MTYGYMDPFSSQVLAGLMQNIDKQPAIHQQLSPRHIAAQLLAGQEDGRPRQIRRLARPPERYPALHVAPLGVVGQVLVVELRADGARQQRVAADAVLAQRHGRALHQAQHARLGRRVVRLQAAAHQRRDGRHADDAAPRWRLVQRHLPGGRLRHVKGAVDVGPERQLQQVWRQRQEVGKGADSRVGDANVEAPCRPGVLDGPGHQLGCGFNLANVSGLVSETAGGWVLGQDGVGFGYQRVQVRLVLFQAEVVDNDAASLAQIAEADGPSDASCTPRDDGGLACQEPLERHGSCGVVESAF